ncbi:hypothetical protein MTO96_043144 [Rhipicephalus appendiculatus]
MAAIFSVCCHGQHDFSDRPQEHQDWEKYASKVQQPDFNFTLQLDKNIADVLPDHQLRVPTSAPSRYAEVIRTAQGVPAPAPLCYEVVVRQS